MTLNIFKIFDCWVAYSSFFSIPNVMAIYRRGPSHEGQILAARGCAQGCPRRAGMGWKGGDVYAGVGGALLLPLLLAVRVCNVCKG